MSKKVCKRCNKLKKLVCFVNENKILKTCCVCRDKDRKYKRKKTNVVKNKVTEKVNNKIKCPCGKIISRSNYSRHCLSKYHLKYVREKDNKYFSELVKSGIIKCAVCLSDLRCIC